jgi:signal transduction histidine kinase
VAVLSVLVWHHLGWHRGEAWGLAVSLPVGAVTGAWLPRGWRHLRRRQTPVGVWDRLNEEFVSYTHTGWCKNLETLIRQGAMLAGDLAPDDREALQERWRAAQGQFYAAVLPKLATIAELGRLLEDTRPVARDLDVGLRRMARARKAGPQDVAAGARELRQTADRLAAVVEARLSCAVDGAVLTAWRALVPELEARGVQGECDLAAVAGVRVRVREHELVMVLQDLLRNALEALEGRPERRLDLTARADLRKVTLEITDTGPGLGGRDPEQLCQPGVTTKAGGSGYGLYHARKTLGAYRGTVQLADVPAGGLTVSLSLLRPLHARGDRPGERVA